MMKKTVGNCVKCGMCLSVCPVYKVLNDERSSPRAKIHLIRSHESQKIESSPLLQEMISKCLMCGSCKTICPLGINHYAEFMEMRQKMVQDHGEKVAIKSLVYLLSREQRLKFATHFARVGQKIVPSIFKEKYKLGDIPLKNFPVLNKKPLRSALPGTIPAMGQERGTVIYFTGCASNYIYDDTGLATVGVLSRLGYRVLIPEDQTCCALPQLFHGFTKDAEKSIKANLAALSTADKDHIDAIIVDCATCGTALKKQYGLLCDKLGLDSSSVEYVASRVMDITSFIMKSGALEKRGRYKPQHHKITYHLPCHLKNSPDSAMNIEELSALYPQIEYMRAEDVDSCCGGGGTFFYEYPELSKTMVSDKIDNARKTGADFLLTDCPVCRMNFSGNLHAEASIKVIHPISFIHKLIKD